MARERRLAFGEVADLYERMRPSYPPALVEDVIALAFSRGAGSALEIGAGTGKATVLFARRGVSVRALEPNAEMAAVAERACRGFEAVTIERTDFEHWDRGAAQFELVYSAQAWHWITPGVRYQLARAALSDGGLLAAFWNGPDWDRCELRDEIDAAYRLLAPERVPDGPMRPSSRPPDRWGNWPQEIDAEPGLEQPEVRWYRWDHQYSSDEYVRLLHTHSDHILLEPAQQRVLYPAIVDAINRHGGRLALTYVTRLCLARASRSAPAARPPSFR